MMYKETYLNGNYTKGRQIKPVGVVTHHNSLTREQIEYQCTHREPAYTDDGRIIPPASYHCVIWKDGSRTIFVQDNLRAWHAGDSSFMGRPSCNNFMLGCCFHGDSNKEPLTNEQVHSFIEWFIPRKQKWMFKKNFVVDHRTVAPLRKVDLNPKELEKILMAIKYLWL